MALKNNFENIKIPTVEDADKNRDSVRYVNIAVIDPDPENEHFYDPDDAAIEELRKDIESVGIGQPLMLRRNPQLSERYIVISGHRRLEASKRAGLSEVPAIVKRTETELDKAKANILHITTNVMVRDRKPTEKAKEADSLKERVRRFKELGGDYKGNTDDIVASLLGVTPSHVRQLVQLHNAPEDVKALTDEGTLTIREAVTLKNMPDEKRAEIVQNLTNASTGAEVKAAKKVIAPTRANPPVVSSPANKPEETQMPTPVVESLLNKKQTEEGIDQGDKIGSLRTTLLLNELDESYGRLRQILEDNKKPTEILRAQTEIDRLVEGFLEK